MAALAQSVSEAISNPIALNAGTNIGITGPPFPVTDAQGVIIPNPSKEWPSDVSKVPLPFIDTGVFISELSNLGFLPWKLDKTPQITHALSTNPEALPQILHQQREDLTAKGKQWQVKEASYRATQLNLTKVYDLIETKYHAFMDAANFEPTIPYALDLEKRRECYSFTGSDAVDIYPPHLNLATSPPSLGEAGDNQDPKLSPGQLFGIMRIAQLSSLIPTVVPPKFFEHPLGYLKQEAINLATKVGQEAADIYYGPMGTPDKGTKVAEVEDYNRQHRAATGNWFHQKDIFDQPNIGDLPDWYTDARFAQQHLTGTNPTTITNAETAVQPWIEHFLAAAAQQGLDRMHTKLQTRAVAKSLYVQDYSYFRKAAGIEKDAIMSFTPTGDDETRYTVAAVCIFDLEDTGELHPLGIVIDWRGSAEKSVTIFNQKVERSDNVVEKEDWPWRYAKTCVQSSDWLRHEITVHLTYTHLMEEATIVAANRSFDWEHMVYKLLYPHWQRTLSVNASARDTLVPQVIVPIVGMPDENVYRFTRSEFASFDFEGLYVPKDLERRGFPVAQLDSWKYHNCAWARCIHAMWYKIREYVEDMLCLQYGDTASSDRDAKVRDDAEVQRWVDEMRTHATVTTFPRLDTFPALVDAVTMCIHLASPQHTSVNYLQNFYQAFVINKPPALYAEPPTSLPQLHAFAEPDLVRALPMNRPREWLLASHIPYLLSSKPGEKESLILYAASKYHVHANKSGPEDRRIAEAAARFYKRLADSELEFRAIADQCDDHNVIRYDVLSPSWNAVSIVI